MRISFMLVSKEGVPQTGKTAVIQLSVDGAPFTNSNVTVNETGAGCYYADIPENSLICQYYVLIKVTSEDCQDTIFEYTPELTAEDIAGAVWSHGKRTLTSLSTNTKTASPFTTSTKSSPVVPKQYSGVIASQILGGK